MIIGHGDIAYALNNGNVDVTTWLYFASGVSNSHELSEFEYQREKDLLAQQRRDLQTIYFSSLSVFYSNTRYSKHKKEMEELVKKTFPHYTIIRLGNITWGENPRTLINYLRRKIQQGEPYLKPDGFLEPDGYRYMVNKDEFLHWINLIPNWNCEMSIIGERLTIKEIVQKYAHTPFRT